MQDPHELPNANVRASSYYVLTARTACPYCYHETRVSALALPPAHQWLLTDDDDPAADEWQMAVGPAVLFHLEELAPAARSHLRRLAPGYRPLPSTSQDASLSRGASLWMNHCDHCGGPLEDDDLHVEPEDAFMPLSAAAACAILLREINEPLQASAAGYVPDSAWLMHARRA